MSLENMNNGYTNKFNKTVNTKDPNHNNMSTVQSNIGTLNNNVAKINTISKKAKFQQYNMTEPEFQEYYNDYINYIGKHKVDKLSTQDIVEKIYENNHTLAGKNKRKCVNKCSAMIKGKGRAMDIIAKHISYFTLNRKDNQNYRYTPPTKANFITDEFKNHYNVNRKIKSNATTNVMIYKKITEHSNFISMINDKLDKIMNHLNIKN